jgi:hypothetical protein
MNPQLLSQLANARTDDMLRAAEQRRRAIPSERSVWLTTTLRRAIVRVRRARSASADATVFAALRDDPRVDWRARRCE